MEVPMNHALLFCTLAITYSAAGAEFTVEGTIASTAHLQMPTNVSSKLVSKFRACVSNCNWFIRVERPQDNVSLIAVDVGSDGNRIYSVSYIQQHARNLSELMPLQPRAAAIRPGPRPYVMEEPLVAVVWLAYASEWFFRNAGNG